jgi:GT2 family glycosyltransferase
VFVYRAAGKNDMIERAGERSVSVVIVNYNAGHLLEDCIRSALPQVCEILLVDNASSDSSIEACNRRFSDEPKLKILRNDANLGFAAACNIGFAKAGGEFVLFLNPDCRLDEEVVPEMLRAMQADPMVGMVGGLLLNSDGTEQGGGRRAVPTPWRSFVRAFGLSRFAGRWPKLFFDFHLQNQPLPDRSIEVEAVSGACMLVRREAVADVGLWDEKYFLHCEDLDWCMRFRQKGWKILFVPSARVTHALGVCGSSRPVFVEWHKHKGMIRFYRKFFRHQYPGVLMGLVALGVWLRFGLVAVYHTARRVGKRLKLIYD